MPGSLVELRDPEVIAAFLQRAPELHFYEIGDLDPFFWPHTRWFGWYSGHLEAVCLLYSASDVPTLLALSDPAAVDAARSLLRALAPQLPTRLYAHLSPGLVDVLDESWVRTPHGLHAKMILGASEACRKVHTSRVVAIESADLPGVQAFYERSYPGHWFVPRMLETGLYKGVRQDAEWLAIGGVHVYSAVRRIAALGNIATDPRQRRRGLATSVTAALCLDLAARVEVIGLNVHAGNHAALACYRALGFRQVAHYDELSLERRRAC